MKAKKLFRFAEIKKFEHVFEMPNHDDLQWQSIKSKENIVLELACGKGEYSVNMAKAFPNKHFIGIDIKGNRMFVGAKKAMTENIENVSFLRTRIEQLSLYFQPKSIQEIWITFPDPFLKDGKAKNRLTHHKFLAMYQPLLKKDGSIHLKTDSLPLFEFTHEMIKFHNCNIIQSISDIYKQGEPDFPLNIQTFYEGMHLAEGRTIYYVNFELPENPIEIPPKKKKYEEEASV